MTHPNLLSRRLAALFLVGLVLLLSPTVSALNAADPVFGCPASLVLLLVVWGSLVGLAGLAVGRARR